MSARGRVISGVTSGGAIVDIAVDAAGSPIVRLPGVVYVDTLAKLLAVFADATTYAGCNILVKDGTYTLTAASPLVVPNYSRVQWGYRAGGAGGVTIDRGAYATWLKSRGLAAGDVSVSHQLDSAASFGAGGSGATTVKLVAGSAAFAAMATPGEWYWYYYGRPYQVATRVADDEITLVTTPIVTPTVNVWTHVVHNPSNSVTMDGNLTVTGSGENPLCELWGYDWNLAGLLLNVQPTNSRGGGDDGTAWLKFGLVSSAAPAKARVHANNAPARSAAGAVFAAAISVGYSQCVGDFNLQLDSQVWTDNNGGTTARQLDAIKLTNCILTGSLGAASVLGTAGTRVCNAINISGQVGVIHTMTVGARIGSATTRVAGSAVADSNTTLLVGT